MSLLKVTVHYTGGDPLPTKRTIRAAQKESFENAGVHWHTRIRPKHFTVGGAKEYGYTPRSPSYERRKFRAKGHNLPLVYSGTSRLLSQVPNIKATSNGVDVRMWVPVLNRMPRASKVKPREELEKISGRDESILVKRFEGRFDKAINSDPTRVTKQLS